MAQEPGAAGAKATEEKGGYGYEFSDDPLNAGGFGPGDATIRVRPGPIRATLIRPRTSIFSPVRRSFLFKLAFVLLERLEQSDIHSE